MCFCKSGFPAQTNFAIYRVFPCVFPCVFALVCFRDRAFAQQTNFAICFDEKKLLCNFTFERIKISL